MVKVNTIKLNQKRGHAANPRKAKKLRQTKLRKSLTPGTVVIPLTGQFRGKHVVMLKQLDKSGMLLCTGPYKLNGVPLRRINARYVIATSTKVDVSGVNASGISDEFFKREKRARGTFAAKEEKKAPNASRKAEQKKVDDAILAKIKDPIMKKYLGSKFALSNSQNAHELKF